MFLPRRTNSAKAHIDVARIDIPMRVGLGYISRHDGSRRCVASRVSEKSTRGDSVDGENDDLKSRVEMWRNFVKLLGFSIAGIALILVLLAIFFL